MNIRNVLVLGFALAFILSAGTAQAASADKKGKKEDTAGKDKDKEMSGDKKDDAKGGTQQTFTGPLAIKPKDAGKDIVCTIISKKKGEKEALLKLEATGDLAKEIEEIRKKGTNAKVTGVLTDDTIKVSKIEEYVKMKK